MKTSLKTDAEAIIKQISEIRKYVKDWTFSAKTPLPHVPDYQERAQARLDYVSLELSRAQHTIRNNGLIAAQSRSRSVDEQLNDLQKQLRAVASADDCEIDRYVQASLWSVEVIVHRVYLYARGE